MKPIFPGIGLLISGMALAMPYTGNDAASSAMGGAGVSSASPQTAMTFNPALLADYSASDSVSITLPSFRLSIEDPEGAIEIADDIEAMDVFALDRAINGDGVSEGSITEVMSSITTNIINIQIALASIQASSTDDDTDDIEALVNASDALTLNSTVLDNKVIVIDNETENLSAATESAYELEDKPLQLGLGVDILNVALPRDRLSMAFSVSSSTLIGATIDLSEDDQAILDGLITDLDGLTVEASELTTELNTLAALNEDLADLVVNEPEDELSPEYATWVTDLATVTAEVTAQGIVVNDASNDVSNYSGTYLNGTSIVLPNDDLTSEVDLVGTTVTELAVSFARRFTIADQDIAAGITPKLQLINVFEKTFTVENASDEGSEASGDIITYLSERSSAFVRPNIDLGITRTWDYRGQIRVGAALKDLIPWEMQTGTGKKLTFRPRVRTGISHQTEWSTVAVDLDLTENQLTDYNLPTRYLGIGGELRATKHAALRVGYRNNLSIENSHVLTGGFSVTPWGVGIEASAWTQPAGLTSWTDLVKDAGLVIQVSARF